MNKSSKEQVVAEFAGKLAEAQASFLADYRGLDVTQVTQLRKELHDAGVEYRVVKNTLLRLAAKGTDAECLDEYLQGPTAIAIAGEDPVAPAKILSEFAKKIDKFELKAGVLSGKLISVDEIQALASLPSREELLAKVLGSINAPASNFVGTLAAIPRQLVQVMAAVRDAKEA